MNTLQTLDDETILEFRGINSLSEEQLPEFANAIFDLFKNRSVGILNNCI